MVKELIIERKFSCPVCKQEINAHLHSAVTAVFCNYCREKIEVEPTELKKKAG